MTPIKQIREVETLADLQALNIGQVIYDIGHRGGNLGFSGAAVAEHFDLDSGLLPRNFGAYCNYLGGGIRGSVSASTFSNQITGRKAKLLIALGEACVRAYKSVEDENGQNDEEYPDGDTNWDAVATKAARNAGIQSAY